MGSYVPNTLEERKKMLREIGYSSIEDLFAHIPEEVKLKGELNIPKGKTEFEVRREMEQIAEIMVFLMVLQKPRNLWLI